MSSSGAPRASSPTPVARSACFLCLRPARSSARWPAACSRIRSGAGSAGGILGAVAGGLLTDPLVGVIGTENLLLVWAGALAVSVALCRVVLSSAGTLAQPRVRRARRRTSSPWRDLTVAIGYVRRSRLLVWMTLAAV